jgi:hypothetical protein
MISKLTTVTYTNYKSQADRIALARAAYDVLGSSAQTQVQDGGYLTKLVAKENDIQFFKEIDNVKSLLAAVPAVNKLTLADKNKVVAASDAYIALDTAQQKYITVGDVVKYNAAIEWLKMQGVETPDIIVGSDKVPGSGSVLTPAVNAVGGAAAVALGADDMDGAIEDAIENESGAIVIAPEITGTAKKVTVELPKASLSSIATDTAADLTVQTPVGSMTIPNGALASIASQALGSTVTMSLEAVDNTTLTAAQQAAVGTDTVYDISVLSGSTHISSFGGAGITISLPYTLKPGEDPSNVAVWYLNDAGQLEQMICTFDTETGMATFTTTHLSKYVVGYDSWTNPFTDVRPRTGTTTR